MIGITNAGGGKDRYRTKVFGGTSAPANPKEGYIWVKTSTPISNYEINCWSKFLPGYSMKDGFTYIYGKPEWDDNRAVNVIDDKGNIVFFNFGKCMQQQGSTLHAMDAFVFHNGSWMQFSSIWNGELFYQGNQFTDVTGGWVSTNARLNGWTFFGPLAPAFEIGANMVVYQTSNPKMGTVFTNKAIDVTNYKQLIVDAQWNIRGAGRNNGWGVQVTRTKSDIYDIVGSYFIDTAHGNQSFDGTFVAVDLSNITGNVYIGIDSHMHGSIQDQDGYNTVTIRKMQLV